MSTPRMIASYSAVDPQGAGVTVDSLRSLDRIGGTVCDCEDAVVERDYVTLSLEGTAARKSFAACLSFGT